MENNFIFLRDIVYGGPGSFQSRFIKSLKKKKVNHSIKKINSKFNNCLLLFAGTKNIFLLLFYKFKKIKIAHRLDGLNWQHRIKCSSFSKYWLSETRLKLIWFIRRYLADKIIYQSEFVKNLWQQYDYLNKPSIVIHNGSFKKKLKKKKFFNQNILKLVAVEGELNCEPMYHILDQLSDINIDVYGNYDLRRASRIKGKIVFKGAVNREEILRVLPSYDAYISLELLPSCPNSVIEAMSFGLPIFGFSTGALYELAKDGALLADYGSNPYKMELPNVPNLRKLLPRLKKNLSKLSYLSWKRHQTNLNIDLVTKKYINFCFD
jgi:glycosyltransferase involved in cell wall biosynthesis